MKKKIIVIIVLGVLLSSCENKAIEAEKFDSNKNNIASLIISTVNSENRNYRVTPLVASRNMHYMLLTTYIIYNKYYELSPNLASNALSYALPKLGSYLYKNNGKMSTLNILITYLNSSNNIKSKAIGEKIADYIIIKAKKDGFESSIKSKENISIDQVPKEYRYRETGREEPPLEPNWGSINTFIESSKKCVSNKPDINKIKNEAILMAKSFDNKKAVDEIVLWWLAGIGTETPSGQWMGILNNIIINDNLKNEVEKIKIASMTATANYDVSIQLWHEKYRFNLLRPESLWEDLNYKISLPRETPNHPSYPSGHSGFASASGTVIKNFYGNIPIYSTLPADLYYPAQRKDWVSVDDAIEEAGLSRIISGFHYPSDVEAANLIGDCVGIEIINNYDTKLSEFNI